MGSSPEGVLSVGGTPEALHGHYPGAQKVPMWLHIEDILST